MMNSKEIISGLEKVRSNAPLVHNITNYVVMNSTANALLSVGASPVMAHAVEEVEDMVGIASSLVINMGTLSEKWIEAMLKAGKKATDKGIPVVFDPVGVGATGYRTDTAQAIINSCRPSVIRGNASEIMALCNANIKTKGVDSTLSADSALDSAKLLAGETGAVVVISGETDYITDGETVVIGGLIHDYKSEGEFKIPLLGDLPLLGWLFKKKTSERVRRELLIFVTPKILN